MFSLMKLFQNHTAKQVQSDSFSKHVNGETEPPHIVLYSDCLPLLQDTRNTTPELAKSPAPKMAFSLQSTPESRNPDQKKLLRQEPQESTI